MLLHFIYFSMFVWFEVKSDVLSDARWTDMNDNTIQISEYCKNDNCLVKCCPQDRLIVERSITNISCEPLKMEEHKSLLNFSKIQMYKAINFSMITNTTENIKSKFVFVRNEILSNLTRSSSISLACESYILEGGWLRRGPPCLYTYEKLTYCVDFQFIGRNGTQPIFAFTSRKLIEDQKDGKSRHLFVIVGLSVSSVFCTLVLVVYCLLPRLRTLPGMILMGYLGTFTVTCVIKVVQLAGFNEGLFDDDICRHLNPAVYYVVLASFFWLNAMSIEVWRITTKPMQRSNTHRSSKLTSGQRMVFCRYCFYAFGTPALLTLIILAVDRFKLYSSEKTKPPFDVCYPTEKIALIYNVQVPVAIITIVNTILFGISAYTLWIIKGKVNNGTESSNTNKSESRFVTCLKIYVLTGVTWILELLPSDIPFVLFIIFNFYNMFVGVAIFYIFVCKKKVFLELCKRLDIKNSFVDRLQSSQYNTEATNSSRTHT